MDVIPDPQFPTSLGVAEDGTLRYGVQILRTDGPTPPKISDFADAPVYWTRGVTVSASSEPAEEELEEKASPWWANLADGMFSYEDDDYGPVRCAVPGCGRWIPCRHHD
jgi:hypothetical protein